MNTSTDKPVKANIFAAGALLWRKSPRNPDEIEIALIHRPKYEDWSFPKGKLDPGETAVVAALREVEEETGFRGRLGRHLGALTYPIPGHRRLKRVEYWAAEVCTGKFVSNNEVDELLWLPVPQVADQLSYPMDRRILRRFTALPPDTATVLLVRHAKAGSRKRYPGEDNTRPLDANGRLQADALVAQLEAFGATEVSSADRTRCTQTVEPLALAMDTDIRLEPLMSEESYKADPVGTRTRARKIAALGGVQVVCSQGGVIPDLLQLWADSDGIPLPAARNRKASMWVLSLSGGKLVQADHIDSPLPPTRKG
ncbi:NUDIX hydrolase [Rhodococcus marinonascens]|uniref:NUDIX hydrolase n=1 Tax=Rhodococcus marinonascens TaxID=38311 RepID=UPI0009322152|nr:bifunctional NUDIX hydrolase/histidine phosphatase family protein [Rhodococcus marinonascens]